MPAPAELTPPAATRPAPATAGTDPAIARPVSGPAGTDPAATRPAPANAGTDPARTGTAPVSAGTTLPAGAVAAAVAGPWSRLRTALALALVLLFAFYGALAIEEAWSARHFMQSGNVADLGALRAAADAGHDVTELEQASAMPLWMQLMARQNGAAYSYGSDTLLPTFIHYAQMPLLNKVSLSVHMLLGGLCMVLGGSQFWPAFRRRYPRLHRAFGMAFVVTAQLAMVFSVIYLLRTPVADTFAQLTFHVGLWFLAIGTTVALWMAMYHVRRREIAQHQGWMGLAYGFLLTAPLLRYDWIALGWVFPSSSMMEVNHASMLLLIPQSFLFGYALVCINRAMARGRARPPVAMPTATAPRWMLAAVPVCLALAGLVLWHYLLAPEPSALAQRVVPASVLANEARVLAGPGLAAAGFALLAAAGLLLAPLFLRAAFAAPASSPRLRRLALALAATTAGASLLALVLAARLGPPSHATLGGGTFFGLLGITGTVFALLLALAAWRQRLPLVREWGLFALLTLAVAPAYQVALVVLDAIGIPAVYLASGHGYLLAAALAPTLLLLGFGYAIYGSASRERVAY